MVYVGFQLEAFEPVSVKGYRVAGGAVVSVQRARVLRRYRVGLRRFKALKTRLSRAGWVGCFGSSSLDARP